MNGPINHRGENIESVTKLWMVTQFDKQFVDLVENYKNNSNVEMLNTIVTTDGTDVEWYQGGEGYTDTIVPTVINSWLDDSQITKSYRKSISINDLMKDKDYDWLHLDVEGIDGDLILALEHKPNVIVYESMNLSKETTNMLNLWFTKNSYETTECNGNTIAVKK